MDSLYTATQGRLFSEEDYDISPYFTPLRRLIKIIYHLPLGFRKLILDMCRIQQPIRQNTHLAESYTSLLDAEGRFFAYSTTRDRSPNREMSYEALIDILDNFYDNPFLCCMISYFVRSEATYFQSEFLAEKEKNMIKELSASQSIDRDQQLDYACLFTDDDLRPVHMELAPAVPYRTISIWNDRLSEIHSSSPGCAPGTLLWPFYNGRKNVSYATQQRLCEAMRLPNYPQPTEYTSLDLLKWYHETGEQIMGPLEIRQNWKFGDLKPRTYYCLGGDAYWNGLFIKEVANHMITFFQSTHPFTRFDVKRIHMINPDEVLITYDYASFTTKLSELKYFLWYVGSALKGISCYALDVYQGPVELDLGQLILEYNEAINHHQVFTYARQYGTNQFTEETFLRQTCSGSLGVQGNIVFSTLNHGVSLSGLTDTPDLDSCVGDDSAFKIALLLLATAYGIINKLGIINPTKVTTIHRPDIEDFRAVQRSGFKYLKRPLAVLQDGALQTGFLDSFPNIAPCLFPDGDGIHDVTNDDLGIALASFCMQWGKFLSTFSHTAYTQYPDDDADITFLLSTIQSVYDKYGLPRWGIIPSPGACYILPARGGEPSSAHKLTFWVPPCETVMVFTNPDWVIALLAAYGGQEVTLPVTVGSSIPPERDIQVGSVFRSTKESQLVRLMVSLGAWSEEKFTYTDVFTRVLAERMQATFDGKVDDPVLCEYAVLKDITWYHSVYDYLYAQINPETTYVEKLVAKASLFGDTTFPSTYSDVDGE